MCLTPPDTQNMKFFFWGSVRIFRKLDSKCPGFGFAVLGNEYPVLVSETRFDAGISRVNNYAAPGTRFRDSFSVWYFEG